MARKPRKNRKRNGKKNFALMRQMASVNYGKMKLSMSQALTTRSDANGQISAAVSPRSLSFTYSPDTSNRTLHFNLQNFAKVKDLWDEYRVYYCKVSFIPTVRRSQDAGLPSLANGIVSFDKDQVGFLTADNARSKKHKKYVDFGKNWTFGVGVPRYTNGTANTAQTEGWQNLQNEGTIANRAGIIAINSVSAYNPIPADILNVGQLEISVYLELRSRQDTNITAYYGVTNPGGEVITDLAVSGNTHQQHLASVDPLEDADGDHPF